MMKLVEPSHGVHRVELTLRDAGSWATRVVELDRVYAVTLDGDELIIRQGVRGDVENPWKVTVFHRGYVTGVEITEQAK